MAGPEAVQYALTTAIAEYPPEFQKSATGYLDRTGHDVELVSQLAPPGARVLDIGGGSGLFGMALAKMGRKVTNVDDMRDLGELHDPLLQAQRACGVNVVEADATNGYRPDAADVVTCFHTLEHLHNSPKPMFHGLVDALEPGGWFVLAGPNAANLRKRIMFPLGKVGWSSMDYWYEQPVMRDHVREPLARDFAYIGRDLGLKDARVFGRNFLGRTSKKAWRRAAAEAGDKVLRRWPGLCSDLYLVGQKP